MLLNFAPILTPGIVHGHDWRYFINSPLGIRVFLWPFWCNRGRTTVLIGLYPKDPRRVSRTDHRLPKKDRPLWTDGSIASLAKMSKFVFQVPRIVLCEPLCIWAPSGKETWDQLAVRSNPFNALTRSPIGTSCERFVAADWCISVRMELPMDSSRAFLSLGI
jgi:hypothetical protein